MEVAEFLAKCVNDDKLTPTKSELPDDLVVGSLAGAMTECLTKSLKGSDTTYAAS